ncbi:hypothetical protein ACUOCP_00200, partial [Escherichia sp. R-CC3]
IAQPRYEIGREAMLLLLDQMQGQHVDSGISSGPAIQPIRLCPCSYK